MVWVSENVVSPNLAEFFMCGIFYLYFELWPEAEKMFVFKFVLFSRATKVIFSESNAEIL